MRDIKDSTEVSLDPEMRQWGGGTLGQVVKCWGRSVKRISANDLGSCVLMLETK